MQAAPENHRDQPSKIEGVAYDRWVSLAGLWLLLGLFIDGWAHINQPQLETFFTPWHAVLYSGATALGGLIVGAVWVNQRRGFRRLADAIPNGYRMSLIGVPVFFVGALGDLLWHELFGIEVNIDALLSPTHLLLAFGGVLMGGGPLRAAWFRPTPAGGTMPWPRALPPLLSVGLLLAVIGFFTAYANPFAQVLSAANFAPARSTMFEGEAAVRYGRLATALGVASILIFTAILSAAVLAVAKRWRTLPFGSMSVVVAAPIVLQVVIRPLPGGALVYIGVALLAGLIADLLYARYRTSGGGALSFRVLAVGVPVALFALYFVAVGLFLDGVWWSVHVWTGAVAMAGMVGWAVSYLVWPPDVTDVTTQP